MGVEAILIFDGWGKGSVRKPPVPANESAIFPDRFLLRYIGRTDRASPITKIKRLLRYQFDIATLRPRHSSFAIQHCELKFRPTSQQALRP